MAVGMFSIINLWGIDPKSIGAAKFIFGAFIFASCSAISFQFSKK